jgi:rod shape-determining protein MreD
LEHYLRLLGIALVLLLLQTLFLPFVSLAGFLPDVFLPWIVYVALRRGQLEATVLGFAIGILQDTAATQFFGLAALSKTIGGFLAGYFFNENTTEQTLGSYRYLLIIAFCSIAHNAVYYTLALQGIETEIMSSTVRLTFGTTLYTTVLSLLPMFAFSQRYHTRWSQG